MRRTLQYLRIAFLIAGLVACVMFIALWARSYVYSDLLTGPISETKKLVVGSLACAIQFRLDDRKWSDPNSFRWKNTTDSVADLNKDLDALLAMQTKPGPPPPPTKIDWTMKIGWDGNTLFLPYWLLVLLTGAPDVAVGMGWPFGFKFSLRTLLIATTLVAIVLGAIVYATR